MKDNELTDDMVGALAIEGESDDDESELSPEMSMLAETMGMDEEKAIALKQFIEACKDEYE